MIWHSNRGIHIGSQHSVESLAQCDHFHIGDGRDRLRNAIQRRIDRQPGRIILIITTRLAGNGMASTSDTLEKISLRALLRWSQADGCCRVTLAWWHL